MHSRTLQLLLRDWFASPAVPLLKLKLRFSAKLIATINLATKITVRMNFLICLRRLATLCFECVGLIRHKLDN